MSLFRRRRSAEDSADLADDAEPTVADDADEPDDAEESDAADDAADVDDTDDADDSDEDDDEAGERAEAGPYDVDDAPDDDLERLDLGSLKIPAMPGVEVQIQANEQGEIAAVALIAGNSAVQVGAFAAPRTEGIWDEVRAELRTGLTAEGGKVREESGPYGRELAGRIATPDGPQDVRFVGIDGPRWFVRAVFHGAVATDRSAAPQLIECLENMLVERGKEAMPVREPLPLQLPPEAVAQQQAEAGDADGTDGSQVDGGR
ncbi:DUF3710 domain-containing protein [Actinocatenispora rupis]|uniref:DUF3710 domain-containing protein n=1 Tax=Actinocatenispora rupis TaxID=519421 RepID=A0A8J3J1I2_9ACTN|nr:DUF3710 domain-containing protein [Actinocatenispora rupis]GID12825.1 hypothetical protein Aru02nite_37140 [Actinocatenispora rupis]